MPMPLESLHQQTGIELEALANMRLVHHLIHTEEAKLNPKEITNIQIMLESFIGNNSINRQLDTLSPLSGTDSGIGSIAVNVLKDLSYRTRHFKSIEPALDKIWKNFESVRTGKVLVEEDKITLQQYGILYDLATLNTSLKELDKKGLIHGNETLEKLYLHTQRAAPMISHFDKTFNQSYTMPTGAVVFDNTKKKAQVFGKTLSLFEHNIASFVTTFGHASKGIAIEKPGAIKENKVSHINPSYQQDKYNLRHYLYSDVYQIKIENLVNPQNKKLLQQHYGDKWLNVVQQKFSAIERQIHDQQRSAHRHISAEGGVKRFAQIATTTLQGGHKNYFMNDHTNSDIRDDIMGRGQWEAERRKESRLLCSEFIGKTIIASVQELNDMLKEDLVKKGVKKEDLPDTLIKNPISETEKLYLLTPERLLIAMQIEGAVEKVQTPHALKKFMAIGEPAHTQSLKEQLQQLKESAQESLDNNDDFQGTTDFKKV